jgi:osmoprotectant transport system substrate-binding protein
VAVDRRDAAAVRAALAGAVAPLGLSLLEAAPASNTNAIVVTARTAERLGLASVSDLEEEAPALTIGGPPECPTRPACLLGLERVYGLRFGRFLALAGERLVATALADGVVDVGVLFSTDGALAGSDFLVLRDDERLQPAENVTPLVRTDLVTRDERVGRALDEVSAALDTAALRFLNWRVIVNGGEPAAEARAWLLRRHLIHR